MYKTTILYWDGDYTDEKTIKTDKELRVLDENGFIYLNEEKTLGESNGKQGIKLVTVYAINKNSLISMELNKEEKEKSQYTHTININVSEKVSHAVKEIGEDIANELRGRIIS